MVNKNTKNNIHKNKINQTNKINKFNITKKLISINQ